MSKKSWIARLCVVGIAGVLATTATPAQATGLVTMYTSTAITDDYAYADVYTYLVRQHQANYSGAIWDECGVDGKGDGAGAYMRGRVQFANGDYTAWSQFEGDSNGCGNSGTTFSEYWTFPNRDITNMQLQLCEVDNGAPGECVIRTFPRGSQS
ncbi:hypothetical protein [Labedaea rhizosphaerae]|uniref:Secreted protein n=1 Tax=Labedaea rhizosphaerae TaxID=598644 RepID=A0A4R6SDV9_LABRH|nr:hypothetical protein [Labedaea rhizosphaerae]TDP98131.1 hypothetical protein EV186_1031111 [Labedaea rhizosphaerae]